MACAPAFPLTVAFHYDSPARATTAIFSATLAREGLSEVRDFIASHQDGAETASEARPCAANDRAVIA